MRRAVYLVGLVLSISGCVSPPVTVRKIDTIATTGTSVSPSSDFPAVSDPESSSGDGTGTAGAQNEHSEVITLDAFGITFTKPEGFVNATAPENSEIEFSGERAGADSAEIYINECPHCSVAYVGASDPVFTDVVIAGQSFVRVEYEYDGSTSLIAIIRAHEMNIFVGVKAADPEPIWAALVDSIEID